MVPIYYEHVMSKICSFKSIKDTCSILLPSWYTNFHLGTLLAFNVQKLNTEHGTEQALERAGQHARDVLPASSLSRTLPSQRM
jgi:hypothetical protein